MKKPKPQPPQPPVNVTLGTDLMVPSADELMQTHSQGRASHVVNERAKLATQGRHADAKAWQRLAHEVSTRGRKWWQHMHGGTQPS